MGFFIGRRSLRADRPGLVVQARREPAAASPVSDELVDINTATAEELTVLEGIGPQLAQRIVDYRVENGPFPYTYELMNVPGIGEKTYEKLREQIVVYPQERMDTP